MTLRPLLARSWLSFASFLVATGCAPQTKSPAQVMALIFGNQGAYEVRQVELKTVTDIVSLDGPILNLLGGARIVVDPADPLLQSNGGNLSDEQLGEIFVKSKGMPPRASYVEKDRVLWPTDFHTWNMVTTVYNFEKAFDYFQTLYDGKPTDELLGSKVYYFPTFILLEAGNNPMQDNALFFSPVQGFAVLPFDKLQQTPLSINLGVVGHEFSHRVFNRKVYEGRAIPDPLQKWLGIGSSSTPAVNLLKAIDEGLADFHAQGINCNTEFGCNTRWLSHSVSESVTDTRDIAQKNKCMTLELRNALATLPASQFTGQGLEYKLGTVLAASLYQAGEKTRKMQVLQKAVVRAYSDVAPATPGLAQVIQGNLETPGNFTLAKVADTILAHITDPALKAATCGEFLDRLQLNCSSLPCAELPACPSNTVKGTSCPTLPAP